MLGCLFWVSPISVQHISLQPTRSNHTVQSILNESTPGCYVRLSLWVSSRPDQTTPFNQSRMKVPLGAMLGCLFWVSPISVQHISLQPNRSNHTVQSIQNESTPGCYVRLSLLSLSHLRPTHLPPANQIKPHHSINPEWKYPWLLCLVAMLGCLFWVSPISVQHISLQQTRSNHTIQSIQNESTPGCYVRLSLLSLSHLRPTHLPPADQIKPHRSINPEWEYLWVLC